jgi:hypothetical protein
MAKQLDLREIRQILLENPSPEEIRRGESLADMSGQDAEYELQQQTRRRHKVSFGEPRIYADVAGVTRSSGNGKRRKTSPHREPRTIPHATVAISYRLRNRALYFYANDLAYYINAYYRGAITRAEMEEILHNVKLMA